MGLEYEDAYIFTASSRYLQFNQTLSVDPLQTHTCVLGSISECNIEATYGGHFITLPSIAYLTHRLLGYHANAVSWINLVAALISVLVLYFLCLRLTGDMASSFVASLVYVLSPAMSVFHSSGLAETTSSLFILIYVSAFLHIFVHKEGSGGKAQWLLWTVLSASFVLALLTKRENLVLLAAPLFALPALSLQPSGAVKRLVVWTGITTTLALLIVTGFRILQIEIGESGDIGASTFSIQYSLALIPLFCEALLTFKWFGISSIIFLGGAAAMARRSIRHSEWTVILGLFLAYFLIYTSHYRSYYFVNYGSVTSFEALRYLTNAFPFFALIAGLGVKEAAGQVRRMATRWGGWGRYDRLVLGGLVIVWALMGVGMTRSLSDEWREIEWEERIAPVVSTLRYVDATQDYVITDLSAVFQVFGTSAVRIVDAYSVGTVIPENILLESLNEARTIWWLRRDGPNDEDLERYPSFYQFMQRYDPRECDEVPGPFSLCKLMERQD